MLIIKAKLINQKKKPDKIYLAFEQSFYPI